MKNMVDAARAADAGGYEGIWIYDHFSATAVGKSWSQHPFTALGALATVTERVRIGCLVANMENRHPVQVASALSTLLSLAPGRVVCGIGAGSGPGGFFAEEHDMIANTLGRASERRRRLLDSIVTLRAIWAGDDHEGEFFEVRSPAGIMPQVQMPDVIVGASTIETALVAAPIVQGVNLRESEQLFDQVRALREATQGNDFDIAVNTEIDLEHDLGGEVEDYSASGITRRTLAVKAPYPIERIREIGQNLSMAGS